MPEESKLNEQIASLKKKLTDVSAENEALKAENETLRKKVSDLEGLIEKSDHTIKTLKGSLASAKKKKGAKGGRQIVRH